MNVVNVYHKSRDVIYKLNFQANGETTWIFTAEGDGEIYSVESDNIFSFSIDSQEVSLPFQIVSGNLYSVSITKNDTTQPASIALKARRANEKVFTQNVPDFGDIPTNGYLYVLLSQSVKVYDCSLLTSSNYEGPGVWTTSPLVTTINLPTTYNSFSITWRTINYDDGDMICWGSIHGETTYNAHLICRIKPDYTVWDYFEENENSVSDLPYFDTSYLYYVRAAITDFIGGNYVLHFNCYGDQDTAFVKVSKSDLSVTNSGLYVNGGVYKLTYNPFERQIVYYGDIDIETFSYKNLLFKNNITALSGYSYLLKKSIKTNANSYATFVIYDKAGRPYINISGRVGSGQSGNGRSGSVIVNQSNNIALSVSTNQSSFAIAYLSDHYATTYSFNSFTETNLGVRHLSTDERSKKFFFTTTSTHINKVIILDADNETTPEIGYIEELEGVQCISNNNYI